MWIVQISVVGLSCWAGPITCAAVAFKENSADMTCLKHIEQISVKELDKSNTFHANSVIRSRALQNIQKLIPEDVKVKHVESYGYIAFDSPWAVKTMKEEPVLAYLHAKAEHNRIIDSYITRFPTWGFERHRGEKTLEHRRMILSRRKGSKVHRRSFMPLARFYSISQSRDKGVIATKKKKL